MSSRREFITNSAIVGLMAAASGRLGAQEIDFGRKSPLKTYRIPHTDLEVSRIAFGCAMLGLDWESPDFIAQTVPLIRTAHEQGITFFDLADMYGYGKSEQALGEVLKHSPGLREKLVIQSKCGERFREGWIADQSHEHIVRSVEGSLKRLGTDFLDVLLLHWPDALVEPAEVAQAFDQLQRSGKVRYFGVSNHNPAQIELLKKYVRQPLVANQIQLSLAHWFVRPQGWKAHLTHGMEGAAVLDYCRVQEIQVQAYSPLRAGYTEKSPNLLNPAADAPPEVKQLVQLLADVAENHSVTPAAVMVAWLLRHPAGIVPVIGGTKPRYLIENCAADRIDLSREEWYGLLHAAAAMSSQQPT